MTFLMDMFESQYVLTSSNTQKAWGDYAQFFRSTMQNHVAKCGMMGKRIFFTGHTADIINDDATLETRVKVKGSLMNVGIESFFSNVLSTKKVSLKELAPYENPLLTITEEDEILGFKYVYQTRLTKKTVGESIRAPMGMWSINETYINNDLQIVLDRLEEFYS